VSAWRTSRSRLAPSETRGGAREQQARDVGARDQQQEADCRHQPGERSAELIAHRREARGRRLHFDPEVAQERGVFRLREIVTPGPIEQLEFGARLLRGRVRPETAEQLHLQRAGRPLAWPLNHRLVRRGNPHVSLDADLQSEERARRDADDGHRRVVDGDLRAERGGIEVEACFPVRPADDGHRGCRRAEPVVSGPEQPARRGPQAKRRKIVARDELAVGELGVEAVTGQAESRGRGGDEIREDVVAVAEGLVVLPRDLVAASLSVAAQDLDEPPGLAHRKRAQDQGVDQAEDGRVGADAERE
jgi:hypothetical protein